MLTQAPNNRAAIALLEQALHPNGRLYGHASPDLAYPQAIVAEVVLQKRRLRLGLVPWGAPVPKTKRWETVWLIQDPRLRQELRNRRESFVDITVAVRLNLPGLVVDRTDLTPPTPPRGQGMRVANPFADRSSAIARALLRHSSSRRWGVRELAREARLDPSIVSRLIQALRQLGLVQFQRTGRDASVWVESPMRLLERWTNVYQWTDNKIYTVHAPVGSPRRFVSRLHSILGRRRWALTLQSGASFLAPHASWDRIHAYVDVSSERELAAIAGEAGWQPGVDGKLALIKPVYSQSVWEQTLRIGEAIVVNELQLVLDLWHYPLRGREQAEHLLLTHLRPIWDGLTT